MKKDNLEQHIAKNTDKYFTHTKSIVEQNGDSEVVYAFFIRKPTIYACKIAIDFLKQVALELNFKVTIYENFQEGDKVGAGDPLFYAKGSFTYLSELETLLLQKIGLPCLSAWHSYMMSTYLPNVSFISMVARHCTGEEMLKLCEYGVSTGSKSAQKEGVKGFIGGSTDCCANLFNTSGGLGTMPHSLIGYAGSTLKAAKMYAETVNSKSMTVLVDYFGQEITDTLEVCSHFSEMAESGNLSVRLDTHGGRYAEFLDYDSSYQIIEKNVKNAFHNYKDQEQIQFLTGMGVSAASIFHMREQLNKHNFHKVKIVGSSGFNLKKCALMADVKAPIDVIGTGSVIPTIWSDTYATADIISYNNTLSVKQGREFLIQAWNKHEK